MVLNCCNNQYIAKSPFDVKGTFRTKHPAQVMVLGILMEKRCLSIFLDMLKKRKLKLSKAFTALCAVNAFESLDMLRYTIKSFTNI